MDEVVGPRTTPMFLTVGEVADLFRRKRSTIAKWCRDGKIEATQMPGGGFLIERETVETMIGRALP